MFDIVYNMVILGVVVVWLLGTRSGRASRWSRRGEKRLVPVAIVFWILLALVLAYYILSFNHIAATTDVDDAVQAAVTNFLHGGNPYREPVVPRFAQLGHYNVLLGNSEGAGSVWSYGTYNYLPLDLLVYSFAYLGLHFLGSPLWFVLANVAFASVALFLVYRVIRPDWRYFAPVAGIVILCLSFNNTSLTLLFIAGGVYARQRSQTHKETMTVVLLVLATLTKAFAAIPLLAFVLYDIQTEISDKNRKKLFETSVVLGSLGACSLALVAFFGFSPVLDSTVLAYATGNTVESVPVGGTLLIGLIPGNQYYGLIAFVSVVTAIAIGLRFENAYDRVLLPMVMLVLVTSQMSYSPLSIAILYLVVYLEDLADAGSQLSRAVITNQSHNRAISGGPPDERRT